LQLEPEFDIKNGWISGKPEPVIWYIPTYNLTPVRALINTVGYWLIATLVFTGRLALIAAVLVSFTATLGFFFRKSKLRVGSRKGMEGTVTISSVKKLILKTMW